MTATPPKRPVGRPKKVRDPIKAAEEFNRVHNPDSEPASKGYVKCVARKIVSHSYHRHQNPLLGTLAVMSVLVLFASWVIVISNPSNHNVYLVGSALAFQSGAILLACIVTPPPKLEPITPKDDIKQIQKYTPPPCEKKDGCE